VIVLAGGDGDGDGTAASGAATTAGAGGGNTGSCACAPTDSLRSAAIANSAAAAVLTPVLMALMA